MSASKPIIFSTPMVRAILEGRKTMTRRGLSKDNTFFDGRAWPKGVKADDCNWQSAWVDGGPSPAGNPGPYLHVEWPYGKLCDGGTDEMLWARVYPRTQPGDLLWVREAHYLTDDGDEQFAIYAEDAENVAKHLEDMKEFELRHICPDGFVKRHTKLRPSIHMPRWASRITLRVTAVKVERLQDISEGDAKAEGIESDGHEAWLCYLPEPKDQTHWASPVESFRSLWTSINGPGAWDANPWVAAYSFERFTP